MNLEPNRSVVIAPARYVLLPVANMLTGYSVKAIQCTIHRGVPALTDNKVVPFRKRPPSTAELEIYRLMTRNWSPEMKQLMFPEHFRCDLAAERVAD